MVFKSEQVEELDNGKETEVWRELIEYGSYAISNYGRIMNTTTDIIKAHSKNQQGISMVNFSINQRQHVRSVAVLVASHFLPPPKRPDFDTPIHLDGNKQNCQASNLMWRPRWFARKYHQQFDPWERANRYGYRKPIIDVVSERVYPNSWEAAKLHGLLDREILLAAVNRTYVFPTNQRFELLEE